MVCFLSSYAKAMNIKLANAVYKIDTLPTQELITFLQQINVQSFYGKPVDSFLLAVPAIPYQMKIYGGSNSQGALFRASYLWYVYSGGPVIRIHVREYTHMNRYSPTATWDVNLFRQEKIYRIDIYKDQNSCINGWCLE